MPQETTADVLDKFKREIERSAVISDSFKDWLLDQLLHTITVAHKQGYNEGVKEERKSKSKRLREIKAYADELDEAMGNCPAATFSECEACEKVHTDGWVCWNCGYPGGGNPADWNTKTRKWKKGKEPS